MINMVVLMKSFPIQDQSDIICIIKYMYSC